MSVRDMPIRPSVEEYLRANHLTTGPAKMGKEIGYTEGTVKILLRRLGLNKPKPVKAKKEERKTRKSGLRKEYEDTTQVVENALSSRTDLEMVWRAEL